MKTPIETKQKVPLKPRIAHAIAGALLAFLVFIWANKFTPRVVSNIFRDLFGPPVGGEAALGMLIIFPVFILLLLLVGAAFGLLFEVLRRRVSGFVAVLLVLILLLPLLNDLYNERKILNVLEPYGCTDTLTAEGGNCYARASFEQRRYFCDRSWKPIDCAVSLSILSEGDYSCNTFSPEESAICKARVMQRRAAIEGRVSYCYDAFRIASEANVQAISVVFPPHCYARVAAATNDSRVCEQLIASDQHLCRDRMKDLLKQPGGPLEFGSGE